FPAKSRTFILWQSPASCQRPRDNFPGTLPSSRIAMNIPISIAMASNPRTWPIFDGRVKPDGITLIPSAVHPSELFWRQLRFADFDVSEMSFSSLIMARSRGDDRWVGLPIFTTRKFFHAEILVRKDSGIDQPGDLSSADLWNHPAVKPLFPDPVAEGIRYYRKTGIFPINHGMVIRKEIVEKHPWVVLNLYKAFERANEIANRERLEHAEYHRAAGLLSGEAKDALGVQLVQHGIQANRRVLERAAR